MSLTLHIVARGKIGRGPEAELVDRYMGRIGWPVRITELPDKGGKVSPPPSGTKIITLDETGRQMGSIAFAQQIGDWRDQGTREIRFLIGAAVGLTADEKASADLSIAFGKATWPHLMARVMLAEQLWRASSILANHPYHREG